MQMQWGPPLPWLTQQKRRRGVTAAMLADHRANMTPTWFPKRSQQGNNIDPKIDNYFDDVRQYSLGQQACSRYKMKSKP